MRAEPGKGGTAVYGFLPELDAIAKLATGQLAMALLAQLQHITKASEIIRVFIPDRHAAAFDLARHQYAAARNPTGNYASVWLHNDLADAVQLTGVQIYNAWPYLPDVVRIASKREGVPGYGHRVWLYWPQFDETIATVRKAERNARELAPMTSPGLLTDRLFA